MAVPLSLIILAVDLRLQMCTTFRPPITGFGVRGTWERNREKATVGKLSHMYCISQYESVLNRADTIPNRLKICPLLNCTVLYYWFWNRVVPLNRCTTGSPGERLGCCDDAFNGFLGFGYVLLDQVVGEDAFDLGLPPLCTQCASLSSQFVIRILYSPCDSIMDCFHCRSIGNISQSIR